MTEKSKVQKNSDEVQEYLMDRMRREGQLTTSGVYESAKDPANPVHSQLEWNDTIAGTAYRLGQVRQIIRRLNVRISDLEEMVVHVPKAVKVGEDDDGSREGMYQMQRAVVRSATKLELARGEVLQQLNAAQRSLNILSAGVPRRQKAKARKAQKAVESAKDTVKDLDTEKPDK